MGSCSTYLKDKRVLTGGGDDTGAGLVGVVPVVVEEVGLQKQFVARQSGGVVTHIAHQVR